jgi:hypothetical protein
LIYSDLPARPPDGHIKFISAQHRSPSLIARKIGQQFIFDKRSGTEHGFFV